MTHFTRFARAFATVLGLAVAASPSQASPVTFSYTGIVTSIDSDPLDPFNGQIGFGSAFSGLFTFDSASPDTVANPVVGSYFSPSGSPFGINVDFGNGASFGENGFLNVGVIHNAIDELTVLGCVTGTPCTGLTMELLLIDAQGSVFSSDALPLAAPLLSAFEVADLILTTELNGSFVEIQGQLTSLQCTGGCDATPPPAAVPEPTSIVLCATGLGGLYLRLLRRTTHQN
jgi:hypothetical protein